MKLSKKRISSVALISFTDVIFLLIIFLLLSSSFVAQAGIKIALPEASGKQSEYNHNISLSITADERIFVNNEQVEWEDLAKTLNKLLVDDPKQVIVVRADKEIALKKLVKLLDEAKKSGTNKFYIATSAI